MSLTPIVSLIPVFFVLAILVPLAWVLGGAYARFRPKLPVTCPESNQSAFVQVDAKHAAFLKITGNANHRLLVCSRWPERAGCGRECLRQVA